MSQQNHDFTPDDLQFLSASDELLADPFSRAAVLWILAETPAARSLCERLTLTILAHFHDDLETATLEEIGLSLNALEAFHNQEVDGRLQAALAHRLVAAEVEPGGPYRDRNGIVEHDANMLLGRYVARVAKPLPKLALYVTAAESWIGQTINIDADPNDTPEVAAARRVRKKMRAHTAGRAASRDKNKKLIYNAALGEIEGLAPHLRQQAFAAINALSRVDKSAEVGLLPLMYAQSMRARPASMTDVLCRDLGIANIFCWVAYTIFDDFIDSEGVAATMPVAAYAQRAMLKKYMDITNSEEIYRLVSEVFNTMDEANSWELNHCRAEVNNGVVKLESLPQYSDLHFLYERSLGHALGPLLLQQRVDASRVGSLRRALCSYLIARQLNDDLHDWVEDLSAGRISVVVAQLLKDAGIRSGSVNVTSLLPTLQKVFWQTTAPAMCQLTLNYCQDARNQLNRMVSVRQQSPILGLIQHLEEGIHHSQRLRTNGDQFLRSWSQTLE